MLHYLPTRPAIGFYVSELFHLPESNHFISLNCEILQELLFDFLFLPSCDELTEGSSMFMDHKGLILLGPHFTHYYVTTMHHIGQDIHQVLCMLPSPKRSPAIA